MSNAWTIDDEFLPPPIPFSTWQAMDGVTALGLVVLQTSMLMSSSSSCSRSSSLPAGLDRHRDGVFAAVGPAARFDARAADDVLGGEAVASADELLVADDAAAHLHGDRRHADIEGPPLVILLTGDHEALGRAASGRAWACRAAPA